MSKGKQTRDEIITVAISESSRIGLEGLSIGTLARHVGMSKSGLFAHFGSKEGLQLSVLQTASAQFEKAVFRPAIREPRGAPRVQAMFNNWIKWSNSPELPGGCLFVSTALEFDSRTGAVRDLIVDRLTALRKTFAIAVELAIQVGDYRADLDSEQFAFEVHSIVLGYQVEAKLFKSPDAASRAMHAFSALDQRARR